MPHVALKTFLPRKGLSVLFVGQRVWISRRTASLAYVANFITSCAANISVLIVKRRLNLNGFKMDSMGQFWVDASNVKHEVDLTYLVSIVVSLSVLLKHKQIVQKTTLVL